MLKLYEIFSTGTSASLNKIVNVDDLVEEHQVEVKKDDLIPNDYYRVCEEVRFIDRGEIK